MKKNFKMTLVCLLSISFLFFAACKSGVNQDELNKKIETLSQNEGLTNGAFTDDEYDFMANYVMDHLSEMKSMDPDNTKSEVIGEYMLVLSVANSQNKLKGNAKKIYDEIYNKIYSGSI